MFLDSSLLFDPANTAVTTTAASTNVIDLGVGRDLGPGDPLSVVVLAQQGFTSATAAATLNIQVQGAPDNGSGSPGGYSTLYESGAISLGQLVNGALLFSAPLATILNAVLPATATLSGTTTASSTSVTAASTAGVADGQFVSGPGIVPGTTVASFVANTSITLSQAATASGTVNLTFSAPDPVYRFLRLNYVASATMTAGQVMSFVTVDPYAVGGGYKPGVVVNN